MNSLLYFEDTGQNIRTPMGKIINPLPVRELHRVFNFFVVTLEDRKQENGVRTGIVNEDGCIVVPFNYYFILTSDDFKENHLFVAEDLEGNRAFISAEDFTISPRD